MIPFSYIGLYKTLNEDEEIPFSNFKSAIDIAQMILKSSYSEWKAPEKSKDIIIPLIAGTTRGSLVFDRILTGINRTRSSAIILKKKNQDETSLPS